MLPSTEQKRLDIIKNNKMTYKEKCQEVIKQGLSNEKPDFMTENKGCPLCNWRGFYYDEVEDKTATNGKREIWVDCECKNQKKIAKNKEKSGIPARYANLRLKDITSVYSAAEEPKFEKVKQGLLKTLSDIENCIKEGYGVGIYGKVKGSGKSMILSAFANEVLEKGYTVRFINQVELLDKIKASWEHEKGEESESDILNDLKTCDLLIIDELCQNREKKDWLDDKMYSLVNNRYENKKPICYTSNNAIEKMNFDERILSRLHQMCEEVEYCEEDVRKLDFITGRRNNFG